METRIVPEKLLDNKYRLVHHTLFISLILLFWFLYSINHLKSAADIIKVILYSSTYAIIAYLNIYYLFRHYLLRGKVVMYLLLSLLTFVLSYLTQNLIYFKTWEKFFSDLSLSVPLAADMMINAITYYMFIGIGLSVKMVKMWMNSEQRIVSLEQENLKATLSNLKSQLSPHFLFNTFNNLYVLTRTNPRIASEMILGFSDLMRYQLNESDKEKVSIGNEINYIENFLALEKLRKDKLDIRFSYNADELRDIQIVPLLFTTLIENAVKHGSQQMEDPYIHIQLKRSNDTLNMEVVNSKPEVSLLGKEELLGTGIDNMKKRLSLCYPLKHRLELQNGKHEFRAKLQIQLT